MTPLLDFAAGLLGGLLVLFALSLVAGLVRHLMTDEDKPETVEWPWDHDDA